MEFLWARRWQHVTPICSSRDELDDVIANHLSESANSLMVTRILSGKNHESLCDKIAAALVMKIRLIVSAELEYSDRQVQIMLPDLDTLIRMNPDDSVFVEYADGSGGTVQRSELSNFQIVKFIRDE